MNLTHEAARCTFKALINSTLNHINKDREKSLLKIVDAAEFFMEGNFDEENYEKIRELIKNSDGKWMKYLNKALDELDSNIVKTAALNLGYESAFYSTKKIREMRKIHNCNIPWAILIDPTSACNLRCKGCWAAEYGYKLNLTFEEIDSIIKQGKELGVHFYLYTGGEPLVRKDDLIKLCEKHSDCEFHMFTNGTLIDDEFCKEMKRVGNLTLSISIDGSEVVNDARRGEGVYQRVMKSMDKLKLYGILFGVSICYTSQNIKSVTCDEFLDMLIDKGVRFIWYFHYMPVGNDAVTELLPSKEQREYMYNRVREIRKLDGGKPIFAIDFQNDGEYVGGCVAGGRNYLHINANGDVEPCVFIHYSSANIKEVSLLDALKQPLFKAYRENQPFNENHLRPCPMLENPQCLRKMVKETGAKSTDLISPEDIDDLCDKCKGYAEIWEGTANRLWEEKKED